MQVPTTPYARSGDLRLAFQQWCDGPPLLIVPALVSNADVGWEHELYRRVVEYLGKHLTCVGFDQRGIGLSDRPESIPTLNERIEDILAVMDAVGWEQASVLGMSEGGIMSQLFAADQPHRVERLILANTTLPFGYRARIPAYVRTGDPPMLGIEDLIARFGGLVEGWPENAEAFVEWFMPSQAGNESFVRGSGGPTDPRDRRNDTHRGARLPTHRTSGLPRRRRSWRSSRGSCPFHRGGRRRHPRPQRGGQLVPSVERLHRFLADGFPFDWRITIVDNASTDATWERALALAVRFHAVQAVHLDRKGRGLALRTAWLDSDAAVVAYMDVDLSTGLDALPPLVAPLVSGHSDVAIGSPSCCCWPTTTACASTKVPVDWVDDPDSRVDVVGTAAGDLAGLGRMSWRFLRGTRERGARAGRTARARGRLRPAPRHIRDHRRGPDRRVVADLPRAGAVAGSDPREPRRPRCHLRRQRLGGRTLHRASPAVQLGSGDGDAVRRGRAQHRLARRDHGARRRPHGAAGGGAGLVVGGLTGPCGSTAAWPTTLDPRATIERLLDMVEGWADLNEFKHTTLAR